MAYAANVLKQVTIGGESIKQSVSYSADARDGRQVTVPDSTTDQQVDIGIDVSTIEAIYMLSDQDIAVETNNGTTPDDTISLAANKPYVWTADGYFANPFSADITALFLTNASGAAADFQLEVLHDSTP